MTCCARGLSSWADDCKTLTTILQGCSFRDRWFSPPKKTVLFLDGSGFISSFTCDANMKSTRRSIDNLLNHCGTNLCSEHASAGWGHLPRLGQQRGLPMETGLGDGMQNHCLVRWWWYIYIYICEMKLYDMIWYDMIWYDMIWSWWW